MISITLYSAELCSPRSPVWSASSGVKVQPAITGLSRRDGQTLDMIVSHRAHHDIWALTKSRARQLKHTVPSPLLTLISFSPTLFISLGLMLFLSIDAFRLLVCPEAERLINNLGLAVISVAADMTAEGPSSTNPKLFQVCNRWPYRLRKGALRLHVCMTENDVER